MISRNKLPRTHPPRRVFLWAKILFIASAYVSAPIIAWAVTQDFSAFFAARTGAVSPLASGDSIMILQGGADKKLAGNLFTTLADSQTLTNKTINGASNTLTVLAATQLSGIGPVANGFTGLSSGTSGGILCATAPTTYAFSAALTANSPVIGAGAGACPAVGSRSGNTTVFATASGALGSGLGVAADANGNLITTTNVALLNAPQTFTGTVTLNSTIGAQNNQSGTTYTLAASDCGKTIYFTNSAAITLTTLNSLLTGCTIAVEQGGAGQITVTSGAGATLSSAHSYTHTFGPNAIIGLYVDTNSGGSAAHFVLTGDGV